MGERQVKIIFNGATGDLARRFHLPGLVAMRDEGGLPLSSGNRAIPDVILVGRNPEKLKATSAETGFKQWTTNIDEVLALPDVERLDQIAPFIAKMRIAKGVSQTELGRRLGVSKQVISRYEETEYQTVAMARLQEILDAIGIKVMVTLSAP